MKSFRSDGTIKIKDQWEFRSMSYHGRSEMLLRFYKKMPEYPVVYHRDEWHHFISPLPWWERVRVRGKASSITPTSVLPRQGGGRLGCHAACLPSGRLAAGSFSLFH
jgi:hypothetical protein